MKRTAAMLLVLAAIGVAAPALSLEGDAAKTPARGSESIVIFPFHNASASSAAYLSWYIPELMAREIGQEGRIAFVDAREISAGMLKGGHTAEALLETDAALALARELGAAVGISGRYILEGKSLRLVIRTVNTATGKTARSEEIRGTVDDNLLDAAEQAAVRAVEWAKLEALSDVLARFHFTPVKDFYIRVRESRAGIVFRNRWLFSLLILAGFYAVSFLVRLVLEKVVPRFTKKTKTTLDDEIVDMARKPVRWLIISLGAKLALLPLGLPTAVFAFFNNVTTAAIIALIGYCILKLAEILLGVWGRKAAQRLDSRINEDLVPLFTRMSRIFIVIITALLILAKFGIEIGPLIASLGSWASRSASP